MTPPTPSSRGRHGRPWRRLRIQILDRDRRICHLCGHPGADTVDHLVPLAAGGHPTDPANLAAAHLTCNSRKGARLPRQMAVPPMRTSRRW